MINGGAAVNGVAVRRTQKVHLGSIIIIIISAGVRNSRLVSLQCLQFALLALLHSPVEERGLVKRDGVLSHAGWRESPSGASKSRFLETFLHSRTNYPWVAVDTV